MVLYLGYSCSKKTQKNTLFSAVSSHDSGINFNNKIASFENDSLNALEYDVLFNGGGVGIGDFNSDGLQDIFFAGNLVSSKLYLNQGDFKFEDITEQAKVQTTKWCTGISVIDLNQDGLLDIYVSVANARGSEEERSNLLFINQGNTENNIPVFKELSAEYGLNDSGFSIQTAFFDYDKDGDLDCYVLTNAMEKTGRNQLHKKYDDGKSASNDHLYENIGIKNGHPAFKNISLQAGIVKEGHGLGLCITDINQDGWLDIYCANDFVSNDVLWINNQDGTFKDASLDYFKHTSYNSMGVDIQDINNDGLLDVCVVDMLPEKEQRRKMMVMKTNRDFFSIAKNLGYQEEYVRNVMQLNQGTNSEGNLQFSEIGQLAGIHATDWSWAPLLADFDNDGYKDLIVTNGYRRDITNLDYAVYLNQPESFKGMSEEEARENRLKKLYELPEIKVQNYAFKNSKNLKFSNVSDTWGLHEKTFSNGAAYADFDNDGDLDLVFNNIDDKASIYRNNLNVDTLRHTQNHYVRIQLIDSEGNKSIGAKVTLEFSDGTKQYQENLPIRGYMSSVDPILFFGLGKQTTLNATVKWSDGNIQTLKKIHADSLYRIKYKHNKEQITVTNIADENTYFKSIDVNKSGLTFTHQEYEFDEFKRTFSLHQQYNQFSPGLAIADVDNNGLDDVFIGADSKQLRSIYLQKSPGNFQALPQGVNNMEDMGALFFDADQDGDQDLYVVSGGSVNAQEQNYLYEDRMYLNSGDGTMTRSVNKLPKTQYSGSVITAADFDKDGDLDLFRGSRVTAGAYPVTPNSYLLINDNGTFKDATLDHSSALQQVGMVSGALWSDYNQDGWLDLIVVGEFMPITFFKNVAGKLEKDTLATHLQTSGWWNSISAGDFDQDGDIDYIVGNLGLNSQYKATEEQPVKVYGADFDHNGLVDPVITYYKEGIEVPVAVRDVMKEQMTTIFSKQFESYDAYSRAGINDAFSDEMLQNATHLAAYQMQSCFIENKGNSEFVFKPLPIEAQMAPVFGSLVQDFNADGYLDVLLVGNSDAFESYTGPVNASMGTLLVGDGKGKFTYVSQQKSGLYLPYTQRALGSIYTSKEQLLVVTNNDEKIQLFKQELTKSKKYVALKPNEFAVKLHFNNGKIQTEEMGYGSGYLTQSSRGFYWPERVVKMEIYNFLGSLTRTIVVD